MILSSKKFAVALLAGLLLASSAQALEVTAPRLVTRNMVGQPAVGACDGPRLSATGRFLAFWCLSSDIVPGDNNERFDTFVYDQSNDSVRRVSLDAANQEQRYHSSFGYPSVDGREVVFWAQGIFHPDVVWVPDDTPDATTAHVYLRNFPTASTELLSRAADGEGNPERDGTRLWWALPERKEILFSSFADYVGSGSPLPHNTQELFLRNWETGVVERISARPDGMRSNRHSGQAHISSDGRFVVFSTRASDLTDDNPHGLELLFLRDRASQMTTRLIRPWHGGEFDLQNAPIFRYFRLSGDGRFVLFSVFPNDEITPDDTPGIGEAYLLDRTAGTTQLVARTHDGSPVDGGSEAADISDDGRIIAFTSFATNLLPGQPRLPGIYVLGRRGGELVNISESLPAKWPGFTPQVDLSADGRVLAFSWRSDVPEQPANTRGRVLVYTVELSGQDPPPGGAIAVPAGSRLSLSLAALLLALSAMFRLRMGLHSAI